MRQYKIVWEKELPDGDLDARFFFGFVSKEEAVSHAESMRDNLARNHKLPESAKKDSHHGDWFSVGDDIFRVEGVEVDGNPLDLLLLPMVLDKIKSLEDMTRERMYRRTDSQSGIFYGARIKELQEARQYIVSHGVVAFANDYEVTLGVGENPVYEFQQTVKFAIKASQRVLDATEKGEV